MCICAGSSGAALVPVVEGARAKLGPRPVVARVVRRPVIRRTTPAVAAAAAAAVAAPVVCPPAGGGAVATGLEGLAELAAGPVEGGFTAAAGSRPGVWAAADLASPGGLAVPGGGIGGDADSGGGFGAMPGATGGPDLPTNSPTPEPGTWVLMIGGFGAVGAAMRRARRRLAARA